MSQLISRKDDNESEIIGIKDGSAAAQVWTEKEYTANSAQISSEQYILFVGNSKLIKISQMLGIGMEAASRNPRGCD